MMNTLRHFIRQEKGGLAILFAIILPFIISCCALAFDGARIMTKRARLADGLNEAALAIATAGSANPTPEEKTKLEGMLNNYIKAYLPNEDITRAKLDVTLIKDAGTDRELPIYSINAAVKVKTILPLDVFPAFAPTLDLSNKGKVRKGLQDLGQPADYVFVVDFSGSMDSVSADPSGISRTQLLRNVVKKITEDALDAYPETTFAIVPFEVGVPVLYDGENEFGGIVNGCSVLMVPKKESSASLGMEIGYDIDYAFWANKSYYLTGLTKPSDNATSLPYTLSDVNKILDEGRQHYYNNYILPSLKTRDGRTYSLDDLTKPPFEWCIKNVSTTGTASYSCDKEPDNPALPPKSIFKPENQTLIEKEMERARRVFLLSYNQSIQNLTAMDIDATLTGMFDEANIISFPKDYGHYQDLSINPYGAMCLSSGNDIEYWYNPGSSIMTMRYDWLDRVKRNTYLIEPTSDPSVINQFLTMEAGGGTHSSTGLLRAVPEMLKGKNPRKVMIVISDGDDNIQYQPVTDELHKNQNVCDKIRKGVKSRTGADSVDIYFISVVNDTAGQKRTQFWEDYCTGKDNAVIATDYDSIMDKLIEIMSGYEETGYFYN